MWRKGQQQIKFKQIVNHIYIQKAVAFRNSNILTLSWLVTKYFTPFLTYFFPHKWLLVQSTMQKKRYLIFNFQGKPLMEKIDFLVLVTNLLISLLKVPRHSPAFCLGVMTITPEQKECPLILTFCRLMIKFCYQS